MPTYDELRHFLDHGSSTPRLREDAALDHLHRAGTRRAIDTPLFILAFDHRTQLESVALAHALPPGRIAHFKSLICEAFQRSTHGRRGGGVIVDDRYCESILPKLTAGGHWIARPVELPGSIPLAFEAGATLGLQLRAWPSEHIAKCLVFFHPDDPDALRDAHIEQLRALARACAATGRELLIEVIPPVRQPVLDGTVARAVEAIYAGGVKPDWWKLPPSANPAEWNALDAVIARNDALCRGVLVLGMEAAPERLRASFAAAGRSPWVRGFAVGRSIFAPAAESWFAGRWSDAQVVDDVVRRYEEMIALWKSAVEHQKETA
jgi:5-dehydro-2-deoxygluconokinase